MDYAQGRTVAKDVTHIVVLVLLVAALWFALVWSGLLQCNFIPGGCEVYWSVFRMTSGGKPSVLIVYGSGGMGNPELLEEILRNPTYVGANVKLVPLEQATIGNLRNYDLVIVEKARRMETGKLRAFVDYAIQGGRLVWTGDAATEIPKLVGIDCEKPENRQKCEQELLYEHERSGKPTCEDILAQTPHARIEDIDCSLADNEETCQQYSKDPDVLVAGVDCIREADSEPLNPWARKDSYGRIINFDQLIGVEYVAGFCDMMQCENDYPFVGTLVPEPEREHPLIKNMRTNLVMRGDFAIVEESADAYTTTVLSVKLPGAIPDYKLNDEHLLPVIVTQGIGQKVAYYSIPPEQFAAPGLPEDQRYYAFIENLYLGMLGFET